MHTEFRILHRSRLLAIQAIERPLYAPAALIWLDRALTWAQQQGKTRTATIVECRRDLVFQLAGTQI